MTCVLGPRPACMLQVRHSNSTVSPDCTKLLSGTGDMRVMDAKFSTVVQVLSTVLTVIFGMEVLFKVLGLGLFPWASVPLNVLDAIVVILCAVGMVLGRGGVFGVLRMMRLLEIHKFLVRWPALQAYVAVCTSTWTYTSTHVYIHILNLYRACLRRS